MSVQETRQQLLSGVHEGAWARITSERQDRAGACLAEEEHGHHSLGSENPPGDFGAEKKQDERINVFSGLE